MGAINLPSNIQNDDDLDAGVVMSDFQSITQVVNGNLEADSNVSTAAAATQPGSANGEGVAATLARSDHKHLIQGFENLAADPTTANFKGRVYWNTVTTELRYCKSAVGVGTYGTLTPTATELVIHAAEHKDGGHDPLADNTLTEHMFAAKGTIFKETLLATHAQISNTGFSTIVNLSVTTTGLQTLGVYVTIRYTNSDSDPRNCTFRVVDVTASNTTIYMADPIEVKAPGVQTQHSGFFYYTTPATGARTLRVQAGTVTAAGNHVDVLQSDTNFNGETLNTPTISAVIL